MGTIKFEIDLPEFEKELSINVTIHRDGEVVYTTTSSSSVDKSNNTNLLSSLGSKPEQEKCISVDGDKQKEEKPKESINYISKGRKFDELGYMMIKTREENFLL